MQYQVIYDGNCNLCVTWVKLLEKLDQGQRFSYIPMQDTATLNHWQITPQDCELGMILIQTDPPNQRWQGSDAAEEIGKLLPGGDILITGYRAIPGAKWTGDRIYAQVRDHRYSLFGKRAKTYHSVYPTCSHCQS